jgi:small subunit ribosomal protein S6
MAKKKSAESSSAQPAEQKPNQYEAMFLLPASAAAEVEKSLTTCRGIIERHGGKILVIKKWDERKLLYEIKKQKRGLYVIAYFTAPGNAIGPMERDVNLSEEVLRVLVTDAEHLNQSEMEAVEPQPIQPREERSWDRPPMGMEGGYGGDRGDRGGDRGDRGGDRGDRGGDRGGERRPRSEAPAGAGKE